MVPTPHIPLTLSEYSSSEWFAEWFNSPYYHLLYQDRNESEAEDWMDYLIDFLGVASGGRILDVGCGRGRYAVHLNQRGFDVTGIDLSPESIAYAQTFSNERLHFLVHDMRDFLGQESFDYVLNLFTSFGYFDTDEEHQRIIYRMGQALRKGGKLVIDFMNSSRVIRTLVPQETKKVGDVCFHLHRKYAQGYLLKDITFQVEGKDFHYQERVKAIERTEFEMYFQRAGLTLLHTFGNYQLAPYDSLHSERMIFVLEKS